MHKAVSRLASASKLKKSSLLLRRSVVSQCTSRKFSNTPLDNEGNENVIENENENENEYRMQEEEGEEEVVEYTEEEVINDPAFLDVDTESFLKRAQAEVTKKSNIHETMKVKSLFDPSMSVKDKRESVLRMIEQITLAGSEEPEESEADTIEQALGLKQKIAQEDTTKAEAAIRKLGFDKGLDDLQSALTEMMFPEHPGADLTKLLELKAGATILKVLDDQRTEGIQQLEDNPDETVDLTKFRALQDYQELDEDEKELAEEQVVDIVQRLRESMDESKMEQAIDSAAYGAARTRMELDSIDEKAEMDAEKAYSESELDVMKQFKLIEEELRPKYSSNQERLHEAKSEKLAKLERDLNAAADRIRNQYAGGNPQGSKLNLQPGVAITNHLEEKEDENRAILFADQQVLGETIQKRRNGEPLHPYEHDAADQALKRFQLREATWTAEVAMKKFKDDTHQQGLRIKAGAADVEQALVQARLKANESLSGPAYISPALHKIPKPYQHAGWKAVAEQMSKEDPRLWNEDKMKQLWGAIDGEVLADKQAFYDRLSEIGGKPEVVNRIRAFFPGFTPGAAEAVADKMIQFLVSSKPDRVPDSIQAVTNRLDEDRENFYEFSHFLTSPRPKMAAIYSSFDKLAKGSNSLEQFKRVAENFVQNDPRLSDNPIEVLYHNLAPLHTGLKSSSSNQKVHEPRIFNGITRARGTRKAALANVTLTPGNGLILINGRSHIDYFGGNDQKIYSMATPLDLLGVTRQFDIKAQVKGGGPTGQSEAIQLAISRALSKFHPEYRSVLRKLGFLTVDTRVVERKKPGQKKARRKFQWVKR